MRAALGKLQPSLIRQIHALKRPTSLDVSLGEPTLDIEPELWARALERYQQHPKGYSANLGVPALRSAIAAYHGLPGRADADNVIVTVGSEEALFLCFFSLLEEGAQVIVTNPSYPAYAGLGTMCGAEVVKVAPSPHYSVDVEAIARAVTPRTRLVVVGSPSNPFGRCDDAASLARLAALAEHHGFWVLSDEIYRELYFGAERPPSIATLTERSIVVSGLSKSCAMTGHRLGYLIAPAELVTAMWPVHQLTVTCAPTLAQALALEAFTEPRFLSAHRPHYEQRYAAAKDALERHGLPFIAPAGGFYVMCPVVPEGVSAFELCKRLLAEQDVVAVPGSAFGSNGERFLRLSFSGEPGVFAEACSRLAAFLRSPPV